MTHLQMTTRGFVEAVSAFSQMGIPWLALGGGGYDVMAVARAWTLAYGVMLGVEWPDAIPESFARKYGVTTLRDSTTPEVPQQVDAGRAAVCGGNGGGGEGEGVSGARAGGIGPSRGLRVNG